MHIALHIFPNSSTICDLTINFPSFNNSYHVNYCLGGSKHTVTSVHNTSLKITR